jgi:hypothetical protein
MKEEYEKPVSREMWYQSQSNMANNIKDVKSYALENRAGIKQIHDKVDQLVVEVTKANGRTSKLENWSVAAQDELRTLNRGLSELITTYKTDKGRILAAIGVLVLLGGSIIGLANMAIDSKIEKGFSRYEIE